MQIECFKMVVRKQRQEIYLEAAPEKYQNLVKSQNY